MTKHFHMTKVTPEFYYLFKALCGAWSWKNKTTTKPLSGNCLLAVKIHHENSFLSWRGRSLVIGEAHLETGHIRRSQVALRVIWEWSDQYCRCDKMLAEPLPPWCCGRNALLPLESVCWLLWLLPPYLLLCTVYSRHYVFSCFLLEETPEWAFYESPQDAWKAEYLL